METLVSNKEIIERLDKLQAQVNKLQEDFEDTQLTSEEIKLIGESLVNEKEGKLISSEDLRRELDLWLSK